MRGERFPWLHGPGGRDGGSSDNEGPWLEIGKARHRPLSPPAAKGLVGTWASAGGKYVFRADGTFESGHTTTTGAWVIAAGGQGTWQLDGYLLAIRPTGAPGWITTIGATGSSFIVIGTPIKPRGLARAAARGCAAL